MAIAATLALAAPVSAAHDHGPNPPPPPGFGNGFKVLQTDMVGSFQESNGFNGSVSGNGCTYTAVSGTTPNPPTVGSNTVLSTVIPIQASGSCSGIGQGELILMPNFNSFPFLQEMNTDIGQVRDYVLTGQYLVVAAGPQNQGLAVVDGGDFQEIDNSNDSAFILRLTGVAANQAINQG